MYANKLTVYLVVVFLILMECRVGAWTRQWAVHIDAADDDLASDIARDHGFTNNGKVNLKIF